jgi:hypothetical protein
MLKYTLSQMDEQDIGTHNYRQSEDHSTLDDYLEQEKSIYA